MSEICKKLNSITGKHFRLPTDREWMFAATGAMDEEVSWSRNDKLKNAWVADNSRNSLHDVAKKRLINLAYMICLGMFGSVSWIAQFYAEGAILLTLMN